MHQDHNHYLPGVSCGAFFVFDGIYLSSYQLANPVIRLPLIPTVDDALSKNQVNDTAKFLKT